MSQDSWQSLTKISQAIFEQFYLWRDYLPSIKDQGKKMKQIFLALIFAGIATQVMAAPMGLHCGTRGNLIGTIASDFLIPDYFPPENTLLRMLLANPFFNIATCEANGSRAHLGASCIEHDTCYATLGAVKDSCDADLLSGWQGSCEDSYGNGGTLSSTLCLNACQGMTQLMYHALRYNDGRFCPSCIAFEQAQAEARGGNG